MSRLFIFSEFYFPDQISTGYYITEIAEHLAQHYDVTVVCVSEVKDITYEDRNGVHIIRIPQPNLDKNKLIQRFLRFLLITRIFFKIGKQSLVYNDQVICVTNPAFSVLAFSHLKQKIKFSLAILVQDVFPENLVGTGILSSKNIIYKFFLGMFNKAYNKADKILVCGRDMKIIFESKLKFFSGEIIFIPNWGDAENIQPNSEKSIEIRRKLKLEQKLLFQFAGNIGRAQGIQIILDASLEIKNIHAHFLFFGDGALKEKVIEFSRSSLNVTYGGIFSREESDLYLNACDIAIVSLADGMKGLGVPSKTYNILSSSKPILYIGEIDSEIAMMIKEENIGYIVPPNSNSKLVEAINYFLNLDEEERLKMGKRAREVLIKKYSKKIVLERYAQLFPKVIC